MLRSSVRWLTYMLALSLGFVWFGIERKTSSVRSQGAGVQLEPVLSGLSSPVFVTNAGDGSNRLFIVEQTGRIQVPQPCRNRMRSMLTEF